MYTLAKYILIGMGLPLIVTLCAVDAHGQDPRFSQYYASPSYFNPALTGAYDGSFRLTSIYRDQWRGAADNTFVSYTAGGDVRFDIGPKSAITRDAAAGGVVFVRDQVDVVNFTTTFAALTGAFHKNLNDKKQTYLSFGFRFGIAQKNVNYEQINFQDEFDGIDQFVLPTNETLPRNNFAYPDLALGINFSTRPSSTSHFNTGFSIDHVLPVDLSFYQEGNSNNPTVEFPENAIYQRYSADIAYGFALNSFSHHFLSLRAAFLTQGPFQEAIIGGHWKNRISRVAGNNFMLGGYLRLNNYIESFRPNAAVLMVGVELQDVKLGISYDINVIGGKLANRNALELSVIYIGDYVNESYMCPSF
jgi:type IX secretion system PorP/SprF family membrane protein